MCSILGGIDQFKNLRGGGSKMCLQVEGYYPRSWGPLAGRRISALSSCSQKGSDLFPGLPPTAILDDFIFSPDHKTPSNSNICKTTKYKKHATFQNTFKQLLGNLLARRNFKAQVGTRAPKQDTCTYQTYIEKYNTILPDTCLD